jgi:mannose-6-phosphate isomerase-like protein (cupin superfamily)
MTVLISAAENKGKYSKIRFALPPGAEGSPLHYHSKMNETFTVIEGCLSMEIGKKDRRRNILPGEKVVVPAGMSHSFCNNSFDWVVFTSENNPATGFEKFIRGLYGLANDGKVNGEGMPTNFLQLAVLLKLSDTFPVGVPKILFGLAIDLLTFIAQIFQVNNSLKKYWR